MTAAAIVALGGLALAGWSAFAWAYTNLEETREAHRWEQVRNRPSWQRLDADGRPR